MEITKYLNCTPERIAAKEYNIHIGISLGNKYFSKDHVREYLHWALQNTRSDVLILLADSIHSINYEVFNRYSPEKALRSALKDGNKVMAMIQELVDELPGHERSLVKVARWDDLRQSSSTYETNKKSILEEFKNNEVFRNHILNIVTLNLRERAAGLELEQKERLAEYVLDEIPIMMDGIYYGDKVYELYPYPSFSLYNELLFGLRNKTVFKELAKKLNIARGTSFVETWSEKV